MPTLHINQSAGGTAHHYRIDVTATGVPGIAQLSFNRDIQFELMPQDAERIRWYLEDYLQFDEEPAPQIAKGVEALMAERGDDLFRRIFAPSDEVKHSNEAVRLWSHVEPYLSSTRIEIAAEIAEATDIPWELLRNPNSKTYLALTAQSFVRVQRGAQTTVAPAGEAQKVRILLVICRPAGGGDVPFRSVAGRLVAQLGEQAPGAFELHVLRPPTYEQLTKTLGLAKERGTPYHIVHFDGHGIYADPEQLKKSAPVLSNLALNGETTGRHGFLAFENPSNEQNAQFVDGFHLGALLRDTGVPVLVLNACQSAFVEARARPATEEAADTREEVEAYGSLAQAVMEAGASGAVAMRYSVYVVTAAQFVTELYGALGRGRQLGEAVTWARRNLHHQPNRQLAYEARPLQDWSVPVVWERAPLRLWPERPDTAPLSIAGKESGTKSVIDPALPQRPDVGFYGRDETLYALDRAFDKDQIVLLHAFAGSGKTATAAEFARWYAATGGLGESGAILFSSFERHLPLARVLDKIGVVFGKALEAAGVHWDAIVEATERRRIALLVLQQMPVLWVWDNVEPVSGFPAGTASDWNTEEQQELRAFLNEARQGKAKFLLTSRRDEAAWLGDLARRVEVPPMPMQERLQLAAAIISRRGRRLAELPDLTPLLRFTQGNPLTILVTVGEALRAGVDSKESLDTFVTALQSGAVAFKDEKTEGRSTSLAASLSYGFEAAFSPDERKILALLYLFQGFVDVDVLRLMGDPKADWCLDAVHGLTRERGIALLDRAAEIGLLTAQGGGYYGIHPALPWFFRELFEHDFPDVSGDATSARSAFTEAIGQLGNVYHHEYDQGRREFLEYLAAEEDNLLAAWRFARANDWSFRVISTMQGLRTLYGATGRRIAWRRLVADIIPAFVEPATDGPLPGREEEWSLVTEYRVRLAQEDRDWKTAERLQQIRVDWERTRAKSALTLKPEQWDAIQRHNVRSLAVSLHELGVIQMGQGIALCVDSCQGAMKLATEVRDTALQAACAFNLGRIHTNIHSLWNLNEAERYYRQSLELRPADDGLGRGRCFGQLGELALRRFQEARREKQPAKELAKQLSEAADLYTQSLKLIPASAIVERGISHNQLGVIYRAAGDTEGALYHYRQDIYYCELAGDIFGAGQTRYNAALALLDVPRLSDARSYAVAALANYRSLGDRATEQINKTEQLIADINQKIAEEGAGTA